jgi:hypothetical protein
MNLTNLQSILAPMLAPIAPAVLFGNNLHSGMLGDGVNPAVAGIAAVLGTGGVELSGALACSMAVMAYHKKDYRIMAVSIFGAVVYAVFVMVGILQAKNTATFAGAVVISLVAYLMQGVWQSYNNRIQTARIETDMQIETMEAQRKLTNSQARLAKAENLQLSTGPVHVGRGRQFQADPTMIETIQAYWTQNPNATLRQAAQVCGCSPMTAGKYKPHTKES